MTTRCIAIGLGWILWAGLLRADAPMGPHGDFSLRFHVAVVDEAEPQDTPERVALRARIVACLQQTIGAEWRELQAEKVKTTTAAKLFKAKECDAVIFFGSKRPRKLRRLDAVTFGVDLGPKRNYEPVYLIVPARDFELHRTILAGFPKALAPLHPAAMMLAVH